MRIVFKLILLVFAFSSNAQIINKQLTIKKVREQYAIVENSIDSCIDEKVIYYSNHYKRVIVYWQMRNCGNVLTDELFYKDNKIQLVHYLYPKNNYIMEEYIYDSNDNLNYHRTTIQTDSTVESVVLIRNIYDDELLIRQDFYKEDSTKIKTKTYHYDSIGNLFLEETKHLKSNKTEYKLYNNKNLIEQKGENGIIHKWRYDKYGNILEHQEGKYYITNYFYDEKHILQRIEKKRLLKGSYKKIETEYYDYNKYGDLSKIRTVKSNGETEVIHYLWTYYN